MLPARVPGPESTSTFYFGQHPIRVVVRDGAGLFVVDDICKAIGTVNPSSAASALAADQKATIVLADDERNSLRSTEGKARGSSVRTVVTEGGMYTLVLRSRDATKEGSAAYLFSRFVTDQVLPSIRRTGAYAAPAPPAPVGIDVRDPAQISVITLQLIQLSQELAGKLATVEAVVEEQRPMVDAYHAFLDDEGLCCLSTAASAIDAPQSLFFAWMRERGFLFDRDGYPQARADLRKDGYFKLRTVAGEYHRMKGQTMVTRAGLVWLRHRWLAGPGKVLALQAAVAAKQASLPGI
jgi:prophage antirepressor-like protein